MLCVSGSRRRLPVWRSHASVARVTVAGRSRYVAVVWREPTTASWPDAGCRADTSARAGTSRGGRAAMRPAADNVGRPRHGPRVCRLRRGDCRLGGGIRSRVRGDDPAAAPSLPRDLARRVRGGPALVRPQPRRLGLGLGVFIWPRSPISTHSSVTRVTRIAPRASRRTILSPLRKVTCTPNSGSTGTVLDGRTLRRNSLMVASSRARGFIQCATEGGSSRGLVQGPGAT